MTTEVVKREGEDAGPFPAGQAKAPRRRRNLIPTLRPSTKLGSTLLWVGGLCILFMVLRWLTGSAAGSKLSGWATSVIVVLHSAPASPDSAKL